MGKDDRECQRVGCSFKRRVRKGLTQKVAFEKRPEGEGEPGGFLEREGSCKALETETMLGVLEEQRARGSMEKMGRRGKVGSWILWGMGASGSFYCV